jgi:hypothetical protein
MGRIEPFSALVGIIDSINPQADEQRYAYEEEAEEDEDNLDDDKERAFHKFPVVDLT